MKIKPCKKCESTDIELWDCGYSSFNPGGGKCNNCGFEVSDYTLYDDKASLTKIWNAGQKLTAEEENKELRRELKDLKRRMVKMSHSPIPV